MLSDARLTRRAVGGDQHAFTAIYRRYHQQLYRFCLAILGSPADAQDALQNTMIKVLRALPGEQREIELKPWLYRIAHNESVELLRRRRVGEVIASDLPAQGPGPAEQAVQKEQLRRLIADLEQLPERQRGTLVMRELAGLEFDQIAAALETSPAVARQTLYEARQSLRQMKAGREMSCSAVTRALSDSDGRITRRRDVRAHLRSCAGCRQFEAEIDARRHDLAALSPLPAAAAAGILHGLLGGHGGSGGLGGLLAGGAAKSLGASAAVKSAAAVAVVAAIGVSAADYGGAIHLGLPADRGSQAQRSRLLVPSPIPAVGAAGSAISRLGVVGRLHSDRGAAPAAKIDAAAAKIGATGSAPSTPAGNAAPASSPTSSHGSSGAHPHGRGHEKQHPGASSHGQETAASHKNAEHGGGKGPGERHPAKPTHPAPAAPAKHDASGSQPPHHEPAHEAEAGSTPTGQPAATEAAATESAPAPHEAGQLP
jgi:RNA polymerase sigma factor (sigma-70 family)